MYYAMATNWDPDLLERLEGRSVVSLYGQVWGDPLGGGRMLLFLPRVGKEEAAGHIQEARRKAIGFNYLINATCLDNQEFTKTGYPRIMTHLEWIASTGVDMVTVSLPFLVQLVKKEFPHIKVCISSFVRIQSVNMARYWEDLGADKIVLPEIIARDFQALSLMRGAVQCELELIANHCCLYHCPLDLYHRNMVSHASQDGHGCGGFAADYCKLECQRTKLSQPAELIRARWIRPEDVDSYEEAGIDCLKLVERFRGTDSLLQVLDAYEQRSFPGNLGELLTLPREGAYMTPNLDLLQRPDLMEPAILEEVLGVLREPFIPEIYVDNSKLHGFIDYFKKADCAHMDCEVCGYCERVAAQAVSVNQEWRRKLIARFDRAIELLTNGAIAGTHGFH
jgi:collagenase-like PrtC family protease